jgi:hypothetical protein
LLVVMPTRRHDFGSASRVAVVALGKDRQVEMGRTGTDKLRTLVEATLAPDERLLDHGHCWAAPLRGRGTLRVTRAQCELVLSDHRLLVVSRPRRRHPPRIKFAKDYDAVSVHRVRRWRPMLQVVLEPVTGRRVVLEFRPRRRPLGDSLLGALERRDNRAWLL